MKKILLPLFIIITSKVIAQPLIADDTSKGVNNNWTVHFQLTIVSQGHPAFHAAYSGLNSLADTAESNALSLTTTLFIGRKLWKGAAFYFNPEIAGGKGISGARGIAGFTNGETFRIGNATPTLYTGRAYLQQLIPLKGTAYINADDDINQVADKIPASRITISAGKFAISDFFDDNKFSHDPRTQFLNWSLMSNGAWDYPANTRGYTYGLVVELIKPTWAARISTVQVPTMANGETMDTKILQAHSETVEIEKSYFINKEPGTVRLLAFHTVSQAPSYRAAIDSAVIGDSSFLQEFTGNEEWHRYGGVKYGFGLSANQDITDNIGVFLRASWNDGKTASWAFTEIDNSISDGININGKAWKRKDDNAGIAFVINGLSKDHRDFLKAGFYGFIIGDGNLNYGNESISEFYYQTKLFDSIFLTGDYQFVNNPGYNKDRGPVSVFSIRLHVML
jgi:high affinity Mn2+ porin